MSLVLVTVVSSCACAVMHLPECDAPNSQKDGHLRFYPLRHHYPLGSEVTFYCEDGYIVSGESHTVCTIAKRVRKAVWRDKFPVCERKLTVSTTEVNG